MALFSLTSLFLYDVVLPPKDVYNSWSCFTTLFVASISAGDALLLWDGPSHSDHRTFAWVYYLKGAARGAMALFTAAITAKFGFLAIFAFTEKKVLVDR